MLGPPKPRRLDNPVAISLEELVPADHVYRPLEGALDLGFVRDLVRDADADTGRPSLDPVVCFKLQLILFFERLRSERQLMHGAADRLSLRWDLGDDLTEPLPDHSSLTRLRERYGLDRFRRFFAAIGDQGRGRVGLGPRALHRRDRRRGQCGARRAPATLCRRRPSRARLRRR
jgi:transposase